MPGKFSTRHGFASTPARITIRNDAPEDLRYAVAQLGDDAGLSPHTMRSIICGLLFVRPNPSNWSAYPNVWDEVQYLLMDSPWPKVYDIAEAFYDALQGEKAEQFKSELNRFFFEKGVGWELTGEGIVFRGEEAFTVATTEAAVTLKTEGHDNAANEIHEALRDISRRPDPDITGSIQHVVAALECTAREVVGDTKGTLGALLPRLALPKPLDTAVEKLWGFASERARHIREGERVEELEAELLVGIACSVCIFLARRGKE